MSQLLLVKLDENNNVVQYPYSFAELRADYPYISFPRNLNIDSLQGLNVGIVESVPKPSVDPINENVWEINPVLFNNKWEQCWDVRQRSEEQKQKVLQLISDNYGAAINRYLNKIARDHNYFSIISACSYATSNDPIFGYEGRKFVEWRDAAWNHLFNVMNNIKNGERPIPSVKYVIETLPVLTL